MSKDEADIAEVVICECGSKDHNLILHRFDEDGWDDEMFISVHLVELPLHKRLWKAVRYVFGYTDAWGHYDEVVLGPDKAQDIVNFLNKFINRNEGKTDVKFSKEVV
jgi:hypothetical protein